MSIIPLLDWISAHWVGFVAIAGAVHAGIVHFYISVVHAGGYRTLLAKFQGPKPPQAAAEKPETKV